MSYKTTERILLLLPLVLVGIIAYTVDFFAPIFALFWYVMLLCFFVVIEGFILLLVIRIVYGRRNLRNLSEEDRKVKRKEDNHKVKVILIIAGLVLLLGGSICYGSLPFY